MKLVICLLGCLMLSCDDRVENRCDFDKLTIERYLTNEASCTDDVSENTIIELFELLHNGENVSAKFVWTERLVFLSSERGNVVTVLKNGEYYKISTGSGTYRLSFDQERDYSELMSLIEFDKCILDSVPSAKKMKG